jgi:arginase
MEIELIAIPYDSARRGERMGAGPQALLDANLVSRLEQHGHQVHRTVIDPPVASWRAEIRTAFELWMALAEAVRRARGEGRFPLVLSGNCAAALGVCAALGSDTAVVWADAHGDFNTPETTVGGFLDGMALATLVGRCWTTIVRRIPGFAPLDERSVWLLGARAIDPLEAEALDRSAIHRVPASRVGSDTPEHIVTELRAGAPLYLHLDLDVLDGDAARANQFAVGAGVSPDELAAFCAALRRHRPPSAITVSSYDPEADADGRAREAAFLVLDALFGSSEGPDSY